MPHTFNRPRTTSPPHYTPMAQLPRTRITPPSQCTTRLPSFRCLCSHHCAGLHPSGLRHCALATSLCTGHMAMLQPARSLSLYLMCISAVPRITRALACPA